MKILVLNAGSSTLKCALFKPDQQDPLWTGFLDWGFKPSCLVMHAKKSGGEMIERELIGVTKESGVQTVLKTAWEGTTQVMESPDEIRVVGHRVVHGGREFMEPVLVSDRVLEAIRSLSQLAPLHNPANAEGIEMMRHLLPGIPQVAVFDTAFHSHISEANATYPGPYAWIEEGIRRYGFHGISHKYCAQQAAKLLGRDLRQLKIITCHLGNGASLAAVKGGVSVDTTMGFTPLEGLMMGTRSGSIDPGIMLYLLDRKKIDADELGKILNRESGLLGIGGASDMREIEKRRASGDARAALAFDIYIHRLKQSIGSMCASLGGLDALVFTAGVGENSAAVRAACCEGLEFLGIKLDPQKNDQRGFEGEIASNGAKVPVLVIKTREEWAIAESCLSFV